MGNAGQYFTTAADTVSTHSCGTAVVQTCGGATITNRMLYVSQSVESKEGNAVAQGMHACSYTHKVYLQWHQIMLQHEQTSFDAAAMDQQLPVSMLSPTQLPSSIEDWCRE